MSVCGGCPYPYEAILEGECETEEEANNRDSILLTLGNLAIIPQSLNAAIRDANWKIKKEGKGKKPGLDICAAGLITMYDVLQKEAWTEKDILDRAGFKPQEKIEVSKSIDDSIREIEDYLCDKKSENI